MIIRADIKEALENGKPVVALESTLISHGLPYPDNQNLALKLEKIVRDNGALPATIAVLNGDVRVGLTPDEITFLSTAKNVLKLNAADVPLCIAAKRHGATTVAATMAIAAQAGIRVFATGGIGGVHRDAADSFDISQDLTALAKYPVAVVCSGAKSILDLPKTLEYLETIGVPVIGLGTENFPSFWSRDSGLKLKWSAYTIDEAAQYVNALLNAAAPVGCIMANPVPEAEAVDNARVEQAVALALKDAAQDGITGGATTPYLLKAIRQTLPETLKANLALLEDNARMGAKLSVSLALQM